MELPWQVSHLMLCLHEEYRFDPRPEIQAVMDARANLRDLQPGTDPTPSIAALKAALQNAKPQIEQDLSEETWPREMSWTQGILKMMGELQ